MRKLALVATAAVLMTLVGGAGAAEVEVKMLNKGAEGFMVFEPSLVTIQPGDSVKFVATDKSHTAETIKGMLPDGATSFAGKMSEDVTVTFDKPGVYGVKCAPHYPMGMVALVVVGTPENLATATAVSHPGKAKPTFAALFDKLSQKTAGK